MSFISKWNEGFFCALLQESRPENPIYSKYHLSNSGGGATVKKASSKRLIKGWRIIWIVTCLFQPLANHFDIALGMGRSHHSRYKVSQVPCQGTTQKDPLLFFYPALLVTPSLLFDFCNGHCLFSTIYFPLVPLMLVLLPAPLQHDGRDR